MSDSPSPEPAPPATNTTTTISGGVNLGAQPDTNISHDLVERDKNNSVNTVGGAHIDYQSIFQQV